MHYIYAYMYIMLFVFVGHLIFELSSGRELSTALPSDADISSIPHETIQEVLNFIFHNESRQLPSIEEVSWGGGGFVPPYPHGPTLIPSLSCRYPIIRSFVIKIHLMQKITGVMKE